jgi:hypothetical protein
MKFVHVTIISLLALGCQYNNYGTDTACETTAGNEKESSSCLIGTWRLVETLMDPGNGSGTYQEVDYDKTITFKADSTFTSSMKLCNDENSTSGSYHLESSILKFAPCAQFAYRVKFENGLLILSNTGCIEACGEKYRRVDPVQN